MKNINLSILHKVSLVAAFATAASATASAAIIPLNAATPYEVTSVPTTTGGPAVTGGNTGTDGYYFFDASGADRSSGSFFSVVNYGSEYYSGDNYAPITINGTHDTSGVTYGSSSGPDSPATPFTFATLTFNSSVPSSLDIGILTGNSNDGGDHTIYTLSLDGGTPVAINTTAAPYGTYFFYADLTGLTSGDTLTISGSSPSGDPAQVTLGGITFDPATATTPEPSTYALMLAGLGALVSFFRLRRKA